jgi:ABC-type sulfate transport system permease subunit
MEYLISVIVIGVIIVVCAWIAGILILLDIARDKGETRTGLLGFIGFFASPIVLGLIVVALPQKNAAIEAKDKSDELPRL